MSLKVLGFVVVCAELYLIPNCHAQSFMDAIRETRPILDMRYRFERVDEDGKSDEALASTLRTRLGAETGTYFDFHVLLEGENVAHIGKDHFNDTVNRRADLPTVADPDTTELNQGYLAYVGIPFTTIKGGRFRAMSHALLKKARQAWLGFEARRPL